MRKRGRKTSEFKNQSTKSLHSNLILWQIKKRSATITLAKKNKQTNTRALRIRWGQSSTWGPSLPCLHSNIDLCLPCYPRPVPGQWDTAEASQTFRCFRITLHVWNTDWPKRFGAEPEILLSHKLLGAYYRCWFEEQKSEKSESVSHSVMSGSLRLQGL